MSRKSTKTLFFSFFLRLLETSAPSRLSELKLALPMPMPTPKLTTLLLLLRCDSQREESERACSGVRARRQVAAVSKCGRFGAALLLLSC